MDASDRQRELTGAVKLVASLAAVDGLVLMTPDLSVKGFGVKIASARNLPAVYDGDSLRHKRSAAREIDVSQFGTRHGSMLRYCAEDKNALGVVISQDGNVRVVATVADKVVLWDNPKLLGHVSYSKAAVLRSRAIRDVRRIMLTRGQQALGFSKTPKTIAELMSMNSRTPRKIARQRQ